MDPVSPIVLGCSASPCSSESVYIPNPPRVDRPNYLALPKGLEATPLVGSQPKTSGYGLVCPAESDTGSDVYDDRKNEFFTLKRFIFMSFGVPGAPSLSSRAQRCNTCCAIPFYCLLFLWGILLIGIAIIEDGFIWKRRCPDILAAKAFTIMAGILFVCVCLYWLMLYWWANGKRNTEQTHNRNFSSMALLWWLLCIYFSAITTALTLEVYKRSDIVFYLGGPQRKTFLHCGSKAVYPPTLSPSSTVSPPSGDPDPDILNVPTNTVPLWALVSLVTLMLVYICVFVVNAVTLRTTHSRKSFWK